MRRKGNRDGFVLVELLIDAVAIVTLLAMPAMFAYQSANQALEATESRAQVHYRAMAEDLENLFAHQAIYYADAATFASAPADLPFESSEGVSISIVSSSVGWSGIARHASLGVGRGCAIYVGAVFAPTDPVQPTRPGEVACSE